MDRYRVYCGELSFEGTQDECMAQIDKWYLEGEIDSGDLLQGGLDDYLADELFHYFVNHSDDL